MNMKRMRGRNHRGGTGGGGGGGAPFRQQSGNVPLNRNHIFDSSGPDLRIRGTSQQLFEKYLQLGRDATSSGDRVMAESYFQHAEHYFRILNAMNQAAGPQAPGPGGPGQPHGQSHGQSHGQPQRRYEPPSDPAQSDQPGDDDQPGGEAVVEHRDIPINAAPPEG